MNILRGFFLSLRVIENVFLYLSLRVRANSCMTCLIGEKMLLMENKIFNGKKVVFVNYVNVVCAFWIERMGRRNFKKYVKLILLSYF